jgi:hypothetical protein
MGNRKTTVRLILILMALGLPLTLAAPTFAASADMGQINSFIKSVVQALAGIAGLVATGFFVAGGFKYITSSGNPEHLSSAKRTIAYSATGLAIIIAAFVISNIVTALATNAFGS